MCHVQDGREKKYVHVSQEGGRKNNKEVLNMINKKYKMIKHRVGETL